MDTASKHRSLLSLSPNPSEKAAKGETKSQKAGSTNSHSQLLICQRNHIWGHSKGNVEFHLLINSVFQLA